MQTRNLIVICTLQKTVILQYIEYIVNVGVKSGYTALAQMTSIVDDYVKTYAISKKSI